MLEVIVTYGAPPVVGIYIAPVTRYVGKTKGEDGGCCMRGAMATWGKTYALLRQSAALGLCLLPL